MKVWQCKVMSGGAVQVGTSTFTVREDGVLVPQPEAAAIAIMRQLTNSFGVVEIAGEAPAVGASPTDAQAARLAEMEDELSMARAAVIDASAEIDSLRSALAEARKIAQAAAADAEQARRDPKAATTKSHKKKAPADKIADLVVG